MSLLWYKALMSKFHKEIEAKVQVDDFSHIVQKLKELEFVFDDSIVQEDTIYTDIVAGWPAFSTDRTALRIRKSNGKSYFTYKKSVTNELDKIEREVEVGDGEIMEDIIRLLGFSHISTVKKKRVEAHLNDINVCLDEVEGLGKFIEVEKMTNEKDGEKVQNELVEFLKELGVNLNRRVFQGYDTLMASLKDSKPLL
jgi:adenylate cyclase class 2